MSKKLAKYKNPPTLRGGKYDGANMTMLKKPYPGFVEKVFKTKDYEQTFVYRLTDRRKGIYDYSPQDSKVREVFSGEVSKKK